MENKIILGYHKNFQNEAIKIKEFLVANNYQIVLEISNNCVIELSKEITKALKKDFSLRVILLDNYGIFPFMFLSKVKKFIVALVTEEHSSHMTMLHNNANILIVPLSFVAVPLAKSIIDAYLKTVYENKRHKIRLEMLDLMVN
ncbi:RpiB/LacA/LacB family sugar-phosphate isomerase [symbiont of Argiope bruennichi]|uniref:RpiB/LacA/LacB family sugar-phosphate isomerase n=1 Tax=symbiont of Argiope bruennichi TaxID=2810479 RepID=UPI003DA1DCB0